MIETTTTTTTATAATPTRTDNNNDHHYYYYQYPMFKDYNIRTHRMDPDQESVNVMDQ